MERALAWLITTFGQPLLGILGLVGVDLLTGIASALRRGKFDPQKIADFYRRTVIPKLLGWVALTGLAYLASNGHLSPDVAPNVSALVGYGGLVVLTTDLLSSIASNAVEIYRKERKEQPHDPQL